MSDISYCDEHGYFDSATCPTCGTSGTHILNGSTRRQVSKFLSGALRHFPDDAGLDLDDAGWTTLNTVVDRASEKYGIDREAVEGIIRTDPKGRFEVDDGRVRAAYGHSVAVDLDSGGTPVPDTLYHGTSPDALVSIREEGLKPMSRQYVHLSESVDDAKEVGSRHAADPVILQINAAPMQADGQTITKRGKSVYTTDHVPPRYLSELD
ncbi:RNA 2'-phosphotransferase [Halonotius terrestris]|uniref:Probable RNA 2'-phosphotransferase n=1 Tax=Halonotius terrestris TaxID=2487750 RepID=A0A8J8TC10_9EURY|nr:RNA 2'-phosphotransferase [Halonotius terrestris]TQQ82935.1 RNA 2'-phosphotransferase [Halonotius terrestris]